MVFDPGLKRKAIDGSRRVSQPTCEKPLRRLVSFEFFQDIGFEISALAAPFDGAVALIVVIGGTADNVRRSSLKAKTIVYLRVSRR